MFWWWTNVFRLMARARGREEDGAMEGDGGRGMQLLPMDVGPFVLGREGY